MNDQRHVIFSQRYKILRNKNINTVLNDFFDEKIKDLEVSYTTTKNLRMKNIYSK